MELPFRLLRKFAGSSFDKPIELVAGLVTPSAKSAGASVGGRWELRVGFGDARARAWRIAAKREVETNVNVKPAKKAKVQVEKTPEGEKVLNPAHHDRANKLVEKANQSLDKSAATLAKSLDEAIAAFIGDGFRNKMQMARSALTARIAEVKLMQEAGKGQPNELFQHLSKAKSSCDGLEKVLGGQIKECMAMTDC